MKKDQKLRRNIKKKSAKFSAESLIKALDICNDGETKYNSVQNKRLLTEFVLLKIHSINNDTEKNDFLEKDTANYKKTVDQKQSVNNQSVSANQKENGSHETSASNPKQKKIDSEKLTQQNTYPNKLEKENIKSISNNEGVKIDKLQSKTFSISEQMGKLNKDEDIEINVTKNNTNCHFDALDLQKCWKTISR